MDYRIERDSMGEMEVPADRYWGAQTQRSYQNFQIGTEKMPEEIVRAFGILKKAAALANHRLGKLDDERLGLISRACDEVVAGKLDGHFPLVVWQTGSGTQSNMNVNEVVANRGNELAGKKLLHPNDHVNMSQSSNDTFPTAMHIAAAVALEDKLLPAIDGLVETFRRLEGENGDVVKSGRTHLQDAVPITLAQEISGWRTSLEKDRAMVELALPGLRELALGGTAVGTGLNAPKGFDTAVAEAVSELTGKAFVTAPNKFHALTSKDELVFAHGALKALAADLMKIANDVRWLASGPRCGLGEIQIPENEPGSSIMPGKINPFMCDLVVQIMHQVAANDWAITMNASASDLDLASNATVSFFALLQSLEMIGNGFALFSEKCVEGIVANEAVCRRYAEESTSLATIVSTLYGYETGSRIAGIAYREGITCKEAALREKLIPEDAAEELFDVEALAHRAGSVALLKKYGGMRSIG